MPLTATIENGELRRVSAAPETESQVQTSVSNSPRSSVSADSASNDAKDKQPQEKICVVCGDVATGTHFAAMTCEGCKGFFRRSMKKNVEFTCAFDKHCAINKSNRKHCQACRLQKCLDMGMNSSLIMSDESVEKKRALIKQNRERKAALKLKKQQEEMEQRVQKLESETDKVVKLSAEDKALIKMMLDSHEQSYDFSYEGYEEFRGNEAIPPPDPQEVVNKNSTLAWYAAEHQDEAKPTQRKGKKESTDNSECAASSSGEHSGQEQPQFQSFNYPDLCSGNLGDFGDMFSSLHGTQKPFIDTFLQQAVASSLPRINSDGSGSSSSSSPYMTPNGAAGFDNFQAVFQGMGPDANGNIYESAQELPGMYSNMDLLESVQKFQGIFNSQNVDSSSNRRHSLFQHFCDIMTWGIKKVIEFCKCIPEFRDLETVDQINLLRGGCLEMLVLRSYFAFASDGEKYKSDKFEYSPENFKEAGASAEFVEQYLKVHSRMRKMSLKVEEICLLLGLVLFSPDRPGIQNCAKVEAMQKRIAQALRAYEYTHHEPDKACVLYSELLLLLPVLRTINVLFSNTIFTLKNQNEMDPLILEVNN